jgi:hypothetical protein
VAVCERVRMNGSITVARTAARAAVFTYCKDVWAVAYTHWLWANVTGAPSQNVRFGHSDSMIGASKISPDSCILFFVHTPPANMADGGDEEAARVLSPGTVIEKPQHHFPAGEKPSKKKKSVAPKASAKVRVFISFTSQNPVYPSAHTLSQPCVCVCVCVCACACVNGYHLWSRLALNHTNSGQEWVGDGSQDQQAIHQVYHRMHECVVV